MQRCSCGGALNDAIDWCPLCYRPVSPRPAPDGSRPDGSPARRPRRGAPLPEQRRPHTRGRWDATASTFALPGRIVATLVFSLPILVFLRSFFPFGMVGIVCYLTVYPRAMRQIWARADR